MVNKPSVFKLSKFDCIHIIDMLNIRIKKFDAENIFFLLTKKQTKQNKTSTLKSTCHTVCFHYNLKLISLLRIPMKPYYWHFLFYFILQLHCNFACPETVTTPSGTYKFPVKGVHQTKDYIFQYSAGLQYEADAIRKYLKAGELSI